MPRPAPLQAAGPTDPEPPAAADDKVMSIIRSVQQDIVFGRLKPRERLVEEEMSARFAVGRHVIRAVLEELDRAGLVVRRPNRGATVRDYTSVEIDQMYDVRRILHREAAMRIALPGSAELVSSLQRTNDAYRDRCRDGELYEAAKLNDQFHLILNAACNNAFLADLIQQFWLKTASIHSRCYAVGNMTRIQETIEEHYAMVRVIATGTNEQLATLSVEHMKPALIVFKGNQGS